MAVPKTIETDPITGKPKNAAANQIAMPKAVVGDFINPDINKAVQPLETKPVGSAMLPTPVAPFKQGLDVSGGQNFTDKTFPTGKGVLTGRGAENNPLFIPSEIPVATGKSDLDKAPLTGRGDVRITTQTNPEYEKMQNAVADKNYNEALNSLASAPQQKTPISPTQPTATTVTTAASGNNAAPIAKADPVVATEKTTPNQIPMQSAAGQSATDKSINQIALDSSIKAIPSDATTRTKQIGNIAVDQVVGKDGKPIAVSFDGGNGKIQWGDASGYNQTKQAGSVPIASPISKPANYGTYTTESSAGNEIAAPAKAANGMASAPIANNSVAQPIATPSNTRTPPQEESFQQTPIKSNVLGGYQDSEDFKRAVKESQQAISRGIAHPKDTGAVKAAQIAEENLKALFGFDVQGNQKTQLEQEQLGQTDLSQRRSERQKQFASLLGADESSKSLAQRQAELEQNMRQFGVTSDLAAKKLAVDSQPASKYGVTMKNVYTDGVITGQEPVITNLKTGEYKDDTQQKRMAKAVESAKSAYAEALKNGDKKRATEIAAELQANGIK